jgi:hypothetical protein
MVAWLSLTLGLGLGSARAQSHHSAGAYRSGWSTVQRGAHGHHVPFPGPISGFYPGFLFSPFPIYGYGYGYGFGPPLGMISPYGFGPGVPFGGTFFNSPIPIMGAGTVLRGNDASSYRNHQIDPAYAAELITLGDRLFRAGNLSRAAERYEGAIKAEPTKAIARVRAAQVAIARGRFADAAERLREAETVEPGWIARAPDIQSLYLEPADFARQISKLEDHLQAQPNDRDAWLVLGAELFLSGRTRRAADIFLRLSDRREDPTLAAFLDATRPRVVDRQN